jgi:fructokinase
MTAREHVNTDCRSNGPTCIIRFAVSVARAVLHRLVTAAPEAVRVYALNLRRGFDAPPLVADPLNAADVVTLNETELASVHAHVGLPWTPEAFWRAACVTLGARGCALSVDGDSVEAPAAPVDVADSVGTGDAATAAVIHGLASEWPVDRIAGFANRLGALVAGSPGAIPGWEPS